MTATGTLRLATLLLGALATAAILLVIDPVGTAAVGNPGVAGVRDFGGIGTLDGTTEGTLARLREMDPERLAGLHRHHGDVSSHHH